MSYPLFIIRTPRCLSELFLVEGFSAMSYPSLDLYNPPKRKKFYKIKELCDPLFYIRNPHEKYWSLFNNSDNANTVEYKMPIQKLNSKNKNGRVYAGIDKTESYLQRTINPRIIPIYDHDKMIGFYEIGDLINEAKDMSDKIGISITSALQKCYETAKSIEGCLYPLDVMFIFFTSKSLEL